jgi:Phytanoyl-CoA dioxygenase (PhyH)
MSAASYLTLLRELYRNRVAGLKAHAQKTELKSFSVAAADALKNDGVFLIPDYYSSAEADAIVQSIEKVWTQLSFEEQEEIRKSCADTKQFGRGVPQAAGFRLWIDQQCSDHRIVQAEKIDAAINRFATDEQCHNMGEYHLQARLINQFVMANKVVHKSDNKGSGGGWHRDNKYTNGFKSMLYLTDVNTNNGPFQYLPGTHHLKSYLLQTTEPGKYQFTEEEIKTLADKHEIEIREVHASAGTLLLFDTNIIHRGKPVADGQFRYAITNYYDLG